MSKFEFEFAAQRDAVLRVLPAKMGYESVDAMIADLERVHAKDNPVAASNLPAVQVLRTQEKRRPRHELTPEIRQKVIDLVNRGKKESEIAAAIGISRPSVSRIKKDEGLSLRRRTTIGAS